MNAPFPLRRILSAWLPVAVWMALIFSASTELGSTRRTSRFLIPFLRWVAPDISPRSLDTVQLLVRKAGHAAGYAILAALLWRARRRREGPLNPAWDWDAARFAFGLAVFYAATDEWHQTFSASRQGSVADVALDSAGAVAGLTAIWLWHRWRESATRASSAG